MAENDTIENVSTVQESISSETGFEPSARTKRMYYSLRKIPQPIGGFELPGLFNYDPAQDQTWVIVAITLEIVSLLFLSLSLLSVLAWYWLAIGSVLAITIDLFFAYWHHWKKGKKSETDNELLRIFPEMRVGDAKGKEQYRDYKDYLLQKIEKPIRIRCLYFWSNLSGFFIVLLAALKCLLLVSNFKIKTSFDTTSITSPNHLSIIPIIALLLIYLFIAYIHLKYSGYWLSYVFGFQRSIKKDKTEFNIKGYDSKHKKQTRTQIINLDDFVKYLESTQYSKWKDLIPNNPESQIKGGLETNMGKSQKEISPHRIYKENPDDPNDNNYVLERNGLLEDSSLALMVERQPTAFAKSAVTIWGHYLQLNSLTDVQSIDDAD